MTWSTPAAVTNDTFADFKPHLLQARDGRVWLFWELWNQTSRNLNIFYKTNGGTSWSPSSRLTSGSGAETAPSAAQLSNGTIVVAFSSNRTGSYSIFFKKYDGQKWWGDTQITSNPTGDYSPSLVAQADGILWLFWMRQTLNGSSIYLKIYSQNGWSPETAVTANSAPDVSPSATQLKDGRLLLTWARTIGVSEQQVFYKTYSNGIPSPDVQFTRKNFDETPSAVQDRNGTTWIFWSREFSYTVTGLSGLVYQTEVMYSYSLDNIVTWSSPFQLTSDPKGFEKQDNDPTVIQASDRRLWVAWSSDPDITPTGSNETLSQWDIYYVKSSPILTNDVHDVALAGIQAPSFWYSGGLPSAGETSSAGIGVTVANDGGYNETVHVSLAVYSTTTINLPSLSGIVLAGKSTTFTFNWNTTGVRPAWHSFQASVAPVPGELNTADNSFTLTHATRLLPIGDVNQDGRIDSIDASIAVYDYSATIGSPKWNPYVDINNNGLIDVVDIAYIIGHYGTIT